MIESEYLTSAGYEVVQADNGKKALQILEEQPVDAVVLDIVMPEMDGWEVIRTIRKDDRLKNLPVIAVTSLGDDELARKGIDEGFDEWELKLDKSRLLEKLSAVLN
jgi:two-component system chemotaxis sensor kinase CheA